MFVTLLVLALRIDIPREDLSVRVAAHILYWVLSVVDFTFVLSCKILRHKEVYLGEISQKRSVLVLKPAPLPSLYQMVWKHHFPAIDFLCTGLCYSVLSSFPLSLLIGLHDTLCSCIGTNCGNGNSVSDLPCLRVRRRGCLPLWTAALHPCLPHTGQSWEECRWRGW